MNVVLVDVCWSAIKQLDEFGDGHVCWGGHAVGGQSTENDEVNI
jgi:hypothetical protein